MGNAQVSSDCVDRGLEGTDAKDPTTIAQAPLAPPLSKAKRHDPERQVFERFDGTVGNHVLEGKLDSILPNRTAAAAEVLMAQSDVPRGITSASYPYHVVYVNQAWCLLCGFSPDEIIGRSLALVQGKATNKRPLLAMTSALLRGDVDEFCAETINYSKFGAPFHVKITSIPLIVGSAKEPRFRDDAYFAFKTEDQGLDRGHQLETDAEREVLLSLLRAQEARAANVAHLEGADEGGRDRKNKIVTFRDFVSVMLIPTRDEVKEAWTKFYE